MGKVICAVCLFAMLGYAKELAAQNILTTAGNGQVSYGGDGGPASSAGFNLPFGLYGDGAGNLYIGDYSNHVIRKVNNSGIVSTVAGNHIWGYTGDHGPATAAELYKPDLAIFDGSGNMYISDTWNNVIRKVDPSGVITTIAGTGTAGYSGDGFAATNATLNRNSGIVFDGAGNLYVADWHNSAVRKISTSGIITTVAGTGTSGFFGDGGAATAALISSPRGLYIDGAGNLLICDMNNHAVRKVNTSGTISTIAGTGGTPGYSGDGGAATAATLDQPVFVTEDATGNLYIACMYAIRKVDAAGIITRVAGTGSAGYNGDGGSATAAAINGAAGLVIDVSGNIYFSDAYNNRIRKVTTSGIINTIYGSPNYYCGDEGPATNAELYFPQAAAFDATGNLYIADFGNNCLRIVRPTGDIISTFAGNVAAGPGYSGDGGPASAAQLNQVTGVATDAAGNIYISDAGNACIRIVRPTGDIAVYAGTPMSAGYSGDGGSATAAKIGYPEGIAVDASGNLYIADAANSCVRIVRPTGDIITFAGTGTAGYSGDGGAATSAKLIAPTDVAVDAAGNVYITDSGASCVRIVRPTGDIITTLAGNGTAGFSGDGGPATAATLFNPRGVIADSLGNVLISDGGANSRIRIVHTSGGISTIAGSTASGFNGDGPLASSLLNQPARFAKDASGNLYVADCYNHRIRRFSDPALGVKVVPKAADEPVSVYPNPGSGDITITYNLPGSAEASLVITNILGEKVMERSFNGSNGKINWNTGTIPGGIYTYHLFSGAGTVSKGKLVVQH